MGGRYTPMFFPHHTPLHSQPPFLDHLPFSLSPSPPIFLRPSFQQPSPSVILHLKVLIVILVLVEVIRHLGSRLGEVDVLAPCAPARPDDVLGRHASDVALAFPLLSGACRGIVIVELFVGIYASLLEIGRHGRIHRRLASNKGRRGCCCWCWWWRHAVEVIGRHT